MSDLTTIIYFAGVIISGIYDILRRRKSKGKQQITTNRKNL